MLDCVILWFVLVIVSDEKLKILSSFVICETFFQGNRLVSSFLFYFYSMCFLFSVFCEQNGENKR